MQQLGYEMAPLVAPIDEVPYLGEAALDYVARMAYKKNAAASVVLAQAQGADLPILTADTTVALAGQILGKPLDAEEARAMLGRLSGSTHQVLSAVCVSHRGRCVAKVQVSDVAFKVLSEEEISAYVATGEPMDKAGGYGVQGQAGLFVRHLAGSFTGVMIYAMI